jgi:hypothetical protein
MRNLFSWEASLNHFMDDILEHLVERVHFAGGGPYDLLIFNNIISTSVNDVGIGSQA